MKLTLAVLLNVCVISLSGCEPDHRLKPTVDDPLDGDRSCEIVPDPKVQQQIADTVPVLDAFDGTSGNGARNTGIGLEKGYRKLNELRKVAGHEHKLVRQLVYFGVHGSVPEPENAALSVPEPEVVALLILNSLRLSDFTIVEALAPCLNTSDPKVRRAVRIRIATLAEGNIEDSLPNPLNPPNFAVYKTYVESRLRRKAAIPPAFAGFLYRWLPGLGLLTFVDAHHLPEEKKSPILWAEHVVSDAIWRKRKGFEERFDDVRSDAVAELEKLSQRDEWWVRLYVAEVVRQHAELRTRAMVERLKCDPHSLVRESITSKEKPVNDDAPHPPSPIDDGDAVEERRVK